MALSQPFYGSEHVNNQAVNSGFQEFYGQAQAQAQAQQQPQAGHFNNPAPNTGTTTVPASRSARTPLPSSRRGRARSAAAAAATVPASVAAVAPAAGATVVVGSAGGAVASAISLTTGAASPSAALNAGVAPVAGAGGAAVAPAGVLLTDSPNDTGAPAVRKIAGELPVPVGVDPEYWHRVYNRADTSIHGNRGGAAGSAPARQNFETRVRALRMLVKDVVQSLDMGAPDRAVAQATVDKRTQLQVASLAWLPNSETLLYLEDAVNIRLARSNWPQAAALPFVAKHPGADDWHWRTDFDISTL
ncbi:hypothetical protein N0V88_007539 [Collariella sp. IMI 366227]|nr:hypothetical protein N0V88_007539 [Collariella sp. IMI 366227]